MRPRQKKKARQMTEYEIVKNAVPFGGGIPDKYIFLKDAYAGTGGFEDGEYLVPHPRESMGKYVRRRFMAYYCNYLKPCIEAHVNPIFKEPPVREYTKNALFDGFLQNVDGKGTRLDRFMKRVADRAKLFGCVFGVVDNFSKTEEDLAAALKNRQYPFIYIVKPDQVRAWAMDRFGNLSLLKYTMKYTDVVDGNKMQKTVTWTWTAEQWIREDEHGKTDGVNTIGVLPIVPLYGALNDDDENELPQSEYYSIAKTNLAIYNACSELRERNRNQAFSLLIYPIAEDDDYNDANELVVSTTDMLLFKSISGAKPDFITPESGPSEMLLSEIQNMIQEIYRMAERANVTGVQQQTSGLSKEWDNQSSNQTIADFAKNLEAFEEKIAEIFGLYIKTNLAFISKYNDDYGVVDVSTELDKVTKALLLGIGGKFDKEVKKIAARTMLNNQDDKVVNAVIGDIDAQPDDKTYLESETPGANNGNV
ncbi:hypothetical protein SAMN05660742_10686 [Propionispira arboris]|uniref:Phage portal protein, SPP1 Gp6-like n=1 Tax=Propionispira arboris TaxID=84035 RepID=A0A1H6Y8Y8_9FIRM|nr:hypothetical protein [Propionispira arboris]SEJ35517.1 hypothetical protein SAMN05660742_10686 [Propionispira arboris]